MLKKTSSKIESYSRITSFIDHNFSNTSYNVFHLHQKIPPPNHIFFLDVWVVVMDLD
jgi:hypothetical protein